MLPPPTSSASGDLSAGPADPRSDDSPLRPADAASGDGSARPSNAAGCGTYALFAVASFWSVCVVVVGQFVGWFANQFALIDDMPFPPYNWVSIAVGTAVAVALLVGPAALWVPSPRFRSMFRTWLVALVCAIALSLGRIFSHNDTQASSLVQSVIALALWAALRWRRPPVAGSSGLAWLAVAFGAVLILPWVWFGALGSPTDTLLALMQGLSFGLLASSLIQRMIVGPLLATSTGSGWDIALGGFAAGVALALLCSGIGFNGNQLYLLLALPPLGFATVALGRRVAAAGRSAQGAMALVIGFATAALAAFVDPAEILLILGSVELPAFALAAAGIASALGWLVGLVAWLLRPVPLDRVPRAAGWGGAAALWLGATAFYALGGTPGLYGDRLFVIMREQADLAPVAAAGGRDERLAATYRLLTEHAERTQADLRARLDQAGWAYTPYYLVNGLEVDGGPLIRWYLEQRSDVDRVLLSPRLRPLPAPLPTERGETLLAPTLAWNITTIGAGRVWNELGVRGAGIVVGQSDSGVQGDHPALRDGYRGRDGNDDGNWFDPWFDTRMPTDVGGHGTHTLGTAVGDNSIGVAPDAEWFACVNLGRNIGNPARYLDCLQFMLAPHAAGADPFRDGDPARAAHVVNNSWGCPELEGCDPASLAPAVLALRQAGIFVVASAGNSGPGCGSVSDPLAIYDDAFSVGAVDSSGSMTSFSSRGPVTVDGSGRPKPDILAPGAEIVSALPDSSYGPNDGTSMAGPHVVGVVALMWSAQPRLIGDVDATERILRDTATPYTGSVTCVGDGGTTEPVQGTYGIIDAYRAVEAALGR